MINIRLEFRDDIKSLRDFFNESERYYVVYDSNVKQFISEIFSNDIPCFEIKSVEENKSIDTVMDICRWLISMEADRDVILVAFGGGITSDVTGFAASIYKRGVRYLNLPTTLLAQVDAAIGGKTGVNVDSFKNMVGTFKQPESTIICPVFLKTLPAKQILSGFAELLKTFIITSEENYNECVKSISSGLPVWEMTSLICKAAQAKADIVSKDEFDKDLRRVLNLGHTYGHAIEWYEHTNDVENPMTHGEAVAIGIIAAANESLARGYCDESFIDTLVSDFQKCGLTVKSPYPNGVLISAIRQDKKGMNGQLHMILPVGFEKIVID